MIRWRVWYDHDRVFDSEHHAWSALPQDGVQLIRVYLEKGWREISGCDWYFKAGDVIGGNNDGPESIIDRYPGANVKRGRWTSDDDLARIKREARN